MKLMEVTKKKIGESTFYIKPFPAFVAANISGELAALVTPIIGGLAPALGGGGRSETDMGNVINMDIDTVLPSISNAFSSLSGDKFEILLKKMLIDHRNVSVECEATEGDTKLLTYDLANEVFCGDVQDMYILCFEVIKINFNCFFKKIGARFGSLTDIMKAKTEAPNSASGASLI